MSKKKYVSHCIIEKNTRLYIKLDYVHTSAAGVKGLPQRNILT